MSGEKARTGLMPIYGHEGACGRGGLARSALLVAGEGAHHAVLAAEVVAAAQRQVLRPAKMGIDCPAQGAAWTLHVDRHGRAAAPDGADDLAAVAGAFPYRRRRGHRPLCGNRSHSHRRRRCRLTRHRRRAQRQAPRSERRPQRERARPCAKARSSCPSPGKTQNASSEGLPVGECRPSAVARAKSARLGMARLRSIDNRRR